MMQPAKHGPAARHDLGATVVVNDRCDRRRPVTLPTGNVAAEVEILDYFPSLARVSI
jgi:hypothetical protein